MQVLNLPLKPPSEAIEGRSIKCLKYCDILSKLAVLRTHFLEIWHVKDRCYKEKSMPLMFGDTTVAWLQGKVFTAGRDSVIKRIDLTSLTVKETTSLEYGACNSLETNHADTQIAAATATGFICFLNLYGNKLKEKVFVRVNQKDDIITCLGWHPNDSMLAAGYGNFVVIYNVATSSPRKILNLNHLVWCLNYLSHTLVTGDAEGKVSFWDASTFNMIQSLKIHKKHVLALCSTEDEGRVWASGEDPILIQFLRSSTSKSWSQANERKSLHTHDVLALTMAKKFLVSGGLDTHLMFSTYPPLTKINSQPYSQVTMARLAASTRELAVADDHTIKIYSLPVSSKGKRETLMKTIESPALRCFAFSSNSKYLAYSFTNSSSIMSRTKKGYKLESLELVESHSLEFSSDGLKLYLAAVTGRIYLLDLAEGCPENYVTISKEKRVYHHLATDPQGEMVAAADESGAVDILDGSSLKLLGQLPRNPYPVSCMAFHPGRSHVLAVCYVNNWGFQYDIEAEGIVPGSEFQLSSLYPATNLAFNSDDANLIILSTQEALFKVKTSQHQSPKKRKAGGNTKSRPLKKQKVVKDDDDTEAIATQLEGPQIETFPFPEHILSMISHGPGQLALLTLSQKNLANVLPPTLIKKKFVGHN